MASVMPSETPRSKGAPPSPEDIRQGVELLDDLLKELDDDTAPPRPTKGSAAEAVLPTPSEAEEGHDEEASGPGGGRVDPAERDRSTELAKAEVVSLKNALDRQQSVEQELREELANLRSQLSGMQARLEAATARFLPAAPVAFLDTEGRSVARKAFYALGRGEGLDHYVSALLLSWRSLGKPLVPRWDPDGFSLTVEGDPEKRSLRVLSSGVYLIKLARDELAGIGDLPTLVRYPRPSDVAGNTSDGSPPGQG